VTTDLYVFRPEREELANSDDSYCGENNGKTHSGAVSGFSRKT
jgi:hypothetical protein